MLDAYSERLGSKTITPSFEHYSIYVIEMKIYSAIFFSFCISKTLLAQTDTVGRAVPVINLSGFADVFYIYDCNQPLGTARQPFLYNHNRHNTVGLNLGFVKLGFGHKKYRANLALQTGTYVKDNYAAETGFLKNILEANMGISLNRKNSLWLDAGIMSSHIGFESAISMDNWTMTRSILAENSPYFQTGVKLTLELNRKITFAGLLLNGWQRIQRIPGSSLPSFGTQLNVRPTDKITLNWSSFIGTDDADSTRRMRYFQNFYGKFQLTPALGIIAGFDIGMQQKAKASSSYDCWFSPVIIAQYSINKTWKTAIRTEYYQDKAGVIVPSGAINGFQTTGVSWNVDYLPSPKYICRVEARWLNSKDKLFQTKSMPVNNNLIFGISLAVKFSEILRRAK